MLVKLIEELPSIFPYTIGELRQSNPATSFPSELSNQTLAEFDVYPVTKTNPPECDFNTHSLKTWVEFVGQEWVQTWEKDQLPEEEAAANIRAKRDSLLTQSDWTQFNDSPLDNTLKQEWATYRESLRMIPQQQGFPWDVQWPSKPT
jgi:hypothetical protein